MNVCPATKKGRKKRFGLVGGGLGEGLIHLTTWGENNTNRLQKNPTYTKLYLHSRMSQSVGSEPKEYRFKPYWCKSWGKNCSREVTKPRPQVPNKEASQIKEPVSIKMLRIVRREKNIQAKEGKKSTPSRGSRFSDQI